MNTRKGSCQNKNKVYPTDEVDDNKTATIVDNSYGDTIQ